MLISEKKKEEKSIRTGNAEGLKGITFLQDVGKAILESYSRVLEGLAFNIVAWIEDVQHVDRTMRNEE